MYIDPKNIRSLEIDFQRCVSKVYHPELTISKIKDGKVPTIHFKSGSIDAAQVTISYPRPATLSITIDYENSIEIIVKSVEETLFKMGIPDRQDCIRAYTTSGICTNDAVKKAKEDVKPWYDFISDCKTCLELWTYQSISNE